MTQATVATYLIGRLKQAGLRHAFGVPGDYVLSFMDRLMEEGIELIGTCNELNAGYAADAYAREVIRSDMQEAGDADVFRKIRADFDSAGIEQSDHQIRRTMDELMADAVAQIEAGK